MAEITLVQAVNDALKEEMRRDDNVVILGEDVGINGGVFRCTADLAKEFGEARVMASLICALRRSSSSFSWSTLHRSSSSRYLRKRRIGSRSSHSSASRPR